MGIGLVFKGQCFSPGSPFTHTPPVPKKPPKKNPPHTLTSILLRKRKDKKRHFLPLQTVNI